VTSWRRERDPDMGRDRETKALGRRDWGWFAAHQDSTTAPSDLEQGRPPWAGHPTTAHDRHDRTLGIPPRHISMWPEHSSAADPRARRPTRTLREQLTGIAAPAPPPAVSPDLLASALADLAPRVARQPVEAQQRATRQVARRHGLNPDELGQLARAVANMITKTTHQPAPPGPGLSVLGVLEHADLPVAARLYLARATLASAAARSDPDLPRLWILANALAHTVPAQMILTVPARSHGPIARLIPEHRDLVGWHGIPAALDHLAAIVRAAGDGRRWLTTVRDARDNRLLALGVLHLTHPRLAHQLAGRGAGAVDLTAVQRKAATLRVPTDPVDLSDMAIKAVCDRNGWLLGTADERTGRELIERHTRTATEQVQHDLANGQTASIGAALADCAPTDADLDRASSRRTPPTLETTQRRHLLDTASREALRCFAGLDIEPHPTRATAYAARFPDRISAHALRASAEALIVGPRSPDATPVTPRTDGRTDSLDL
jgi:hypothetical protein